MMNEANPKNVLAIEQEDRQQGLPRVHQRGFKDPGLDEDWQAQSRGKAEDKNVSKNAEGDEVSESDHLLPLPKSPSASTSISLDPNKDLNFDIIEKQFKFEKPSHLLSLDIRNRNAKIDTTIPEISTKLKSLNVLPVKTRGLFGWSKTTPARSFVAFGPNFLKIVDAGRKRHGHWALLYLL
jgi:hypothetical protein